MHQGKHQEYEKRLHDSLIAQMQQQAANPTSTIITNATVSPASTPPLSGVQVTANGVGTSIKFSDGKDSNNGPIQGKDAWPSLSTSPLPKENGGKVKNGEIPFFSICITFFFSCKHIFFRCQWLQ